MSDPFATAGFVRLRPGREASVLRGHPWIYRGAIGDAPSPGSLRPVEVRDHRGRRLGVALQSDSHGSMALRMLSFGEQPWDRATLMARLEDALDLRTRLAIDADAVRLVHAEGDRLPGLVIDRYADWAVVQMFEPAWAPFADAIAEWLRARAACGHVLLRGVRSGPDAIISSGEGPPPVVVIREGLARYRVDLASGQKTGFFIDQRNNRRRLGELARGCEILNLFAYTGAFSVAALLSGARRARNVDASADALALARANYALNGLQVGDDDFVRGDAFRVTRDLVSSGARFSAVVVDPPAFVKQRRDRGRGLEGYRDINLQALALVSTGGWLVTCSCSALVSEDEFEGAVRAAAIDARRDVVIVEKRGAGADHPVLAVCPESRHLKCLVCLVR